MLRCYKQPGPKARQRALFHHGGSCAIQTPVKAQGMTRKIKRQIAKEENALGPVITVD